MALGVGKSIGPLSGRLSLRTIGRRLIGCRGRLGLAAGFAVRALRRAGFAGVTRQRGVLRRIGAGCVGAGGGRIRIRLLGLAVACHCGAGLDGLLGFLCYRGHVALFSLGALHLALGTDLSVI